MKIKPWMYGVGVLGVAGVGIVIYEVAKKPAAAATNPAAVAAAVAAVRAIVVATTVPSISVNRPAIGAPNTFSSTPAPAGPVINPVSSVATGVGLTSGQAITLVLPAGGSWVGIAVGASSNPSQGLGNAALGTDLTSPVSFPFAALPLGSNLMMVVWKNAAGTEQYQSVSYPTIAAPKALTL